MRPITLAALTLLLACRPPTPIEADLAITDGTVIDVATGEELPDRTVLVAGNRIVAVGPRDELGVDEDAEVVDATGMYLIPGLWDSHVHSAANVSWHFPLFIAHGVTSVRNMHSTVDTSLALTRSVKRRLASGELIGPRFLQNGGVVDGAPPIWPGSAVATTPDQGPAIVDSLRAAHRELLETIDELPSSQGEIGFFRMVRAAVEARDPERCRATIDAYLEHDVAVVPAFVVFMGPEGLLSDSSRMAMLPAVFREQWTAMAQGPPHPVASLMAPVREVTDENRRMLHEAGVPFLAGTDLGHPFLVPGASLHDELEALVEIVGMSPLEALRAATLGPARTFGMADSLGTVEREMLADLVLLHSNPLEDIRHSREISGVVLNGRYFDRGDLDGLIVEAAR